MVGTRTEQQRRIRQHITALGPRGVTSRVPDPLRAKIVAYAQARRSAGTSWQALAAEVGFSVGALQRWTAAAHGTVVPVTVRPDGDAPRERAGLALITPSGVRVEGLDVVAAVTLLRALA